MMPRALAIHVRFHDGRYHGAGDWPPSPARLFQALVAAAGLNGQVSGARDPLRWLETLPPPIVGVPYARRGQRVMFYMPNNDLDAVQGDPRRVAKIRTAKKFFNPWLFDAATPFLYVWGDVADADDGHAQAIVAMAERLYQFGRGIDMAWAWGELLDAADVEDLLARHPCAVYRPSAHGGGVTLLCPRPGSMASAEERYEAYCRRFMAERTFRQPPRPAFRPSAYESPPCRRLFQLCARSGDWSLVSWPLAEVSKLVVCLRDSAVRRLAMALADRKAEIDRVLVGRKLDGTNDGPTAERVRIIPLPSIGHPHADRAIRRVLIEMPPGCPIPIDDIAWAFSGLEPIDAQTGEVYPVLLTPVPSDSMLHHYGVDEGSRASTWRTVTPAVLPDAAGRRRIDPARKMAEAKGGAERAEEQRCAAAGVAQALRHADVRARVQSIRVQREPFESNGERVEAFAPGTRFPHRRLWHIEISFSEPIAGPLVVGDGRFLGLGVMAPVSTSRGLRTFLVESGLVETPDPVVVARSLRRAVMARVQETLADSVLPAFFSGHGRGGTPARTERSSHLAFAFDPARSRLVIAAPHALDRRNPTREEKDQLKVLDQALKGLTELRAGSAGRLALRSIWLDVDADVLTAPSRTWESVTPYCVTRHGKRVAATEVLSADLRTECRRRGLPEPVNVSPLEARGFPGVGLMGRARIMFSVAVRGPVFLGRSRYVGGGLFAGRAHKPG